MTNTEILKTSKNLLSALDKQRQFVLKKALEPLTCPACHTPCSQVEASDTAKGEVDTFPVDDSSLTDTFHCTGCGRALKHAVYLFGGHGWTLTEEEAIKLRRLLINGDTPDADTVIATDTAVLDPRD